MIFRSRFMPCAQCGASIDRYAASPHACSPTQRADFQMFALRDGVAELETDLSRYLESASGRFESWLAARQVRSRA